MVRLRACARGVHPASHEQPLDEALKQASELSDHDYKVAKQAMIAIATGVVLDVEYDGLTRLCEVHAVGLSTKGTPVMRVYQLDAGQHHDTGTKPPSPWRMMALDKVRAVPQLVDIKSQAPREGYRKGDAGMRHIFTEL